MTFNAIRGNLQFLDSKLSEYGASNVPVGNNGQTGGSKDRMKTIYPTPKFPGRIINVY